VNTAAETGRTLGAELIFQPSPNLRLSTYVARTDFDDHIVKLVGRSYYYLQTYALANVQESRADTAEVAARWKPADRLTLDGSISWLSHRNTSGVGAPIDLTLPVVTVVVDFDRVPYQPVRTGSVAATLELPGSVSLTGQASYTGEMLIQQFSPELAPFPPPNPDDPLSLLLPNMRRTPGFWLAGLAFRAPLGRDLELVGGVDNITDRIQTDLRDPTTDFNWGPLTGRSWRLGLRYSQDSRRIGS
jgi:outer membrane receptor protein involved in Fe transport